MGKNKREKDKDRDRDDSHTTGGIRVKFYLLKTSSAMQLEFLDSKFLLLKPEQSIWFADTANTFYRVLIYSTKEEKLIGRVKVKADSQKIGNLYLIKEIPEQTEYGHFVEIDWERKANYHKKRLTDFSFVEKQTAQMQAISQIDGEKLSDFMDYPEDFKRTNMPLKPPMYPLPRVSGELYPAFPYQHFFQQSQQDPNAGYLNFQKKNKKRQTSYSMESQGSGSSRSSSYSGESSNSSSKDSSPRNRKSSKRDRSEKDKKKSRKDKERKRDKDDRRSRKSRDQKSKDRRSKDKRDKRSRDRRKDDKEKSRKDDKERDRKDKKRSYDREKDKSKERSRNKNKKEYSRDRDKSRREKDRAKDDKRSKDRRDKDSDKDKNRIKREKDRAISNKEKSLSKPSAPDNKEKELKKVQSKLQSVRQEKVEDNADRVSQSINLSSESDAQNYSQVQSEHKNQENEDFKMKKDKKPIESRFE